MKDVHARIRAKQRVENEAPYVKPWRDLQKKCATNTKTPRDFALGNKGWQSDKTTVWYDGDWNDD